jgi:hypothetical protein
MPGGAKGAVKYVVKTKFGQSAIAGAAVEGVKAVHENAGNLLGGVLDICLADAEDDALDNPHFTQNGHDGPSPNSNRYLFAKKGLGFAGTIATSLADAGGFTSGAVAAQDSVVWYRINALFQKMIPASRRAKPPQYAAWYSWEVARKAVSAGSLEIQLTRIMRQKLYSGAGGATKAGIAFGTGGLLGIFVNAAASQVQEGLDAMFGQDVQTLAQGLHWMAYREQAVGRIAGGGNGPANRILDVIWQQFALGHGGAVTRKDIVSEPRGWLVIADLLS